MGKKQKQRQVLFSWASKLLQMVIAAMKLKYALWRESYDKHREHIKKQRHHFVDKSPYSQKLWFFPVVMYACESWTIKKAKYRRIDPLNYGAGEDS